MTFKQALSLITEANKSAAHAYHSCAAVFALAESRKPTKADEQPKYRDIDKLMSEAFASAVARSVLSSAGRKEQAPPSVN